MRRSHDGLKPNKAIMICDTCGAPKLMHHVCAACGTYRSHQVLPATDEAQA
jgi:ribosomal protein L32